MLFLCQVRLVQVRETITCDETDCEPNVEVRTWRYIRFEMAAIRGPLFCCSWERGDLHGGIRVLTRFARPPDAEKNAMLRHCR